MTAAIFGLLGVLIGAMTAGGFELFFERRRDRADLRQAKRLVAGEIHTQWLHHDLLLHEGRLPRHDLDKLMPTAAWEENSAVLARHLTDELWGFLSMGEHATQRTGEVLMREAPETPIAPEWTAKLQNGRDLLASAYRELTGNEP